jgi:hypothetical protein
MFDKVERRSFNRELLKVSNDVNDFNEAGFYLLREACLLLAEVVTFECNVPAFGGPKLNRFDAIVYGTLAKISKLNTVLIQQLSERRLEVVFVLLRVIADACIDVVYLCKFGSKEIEREFILATSSESKRLALRVLENARTRKRLLPIEKRMLRSIVNGWRVGGIKGREINEKDNRGVWAEKNSYEKAKKVGLESVYHYTFANASTSVHSSWRDLVHFHIYKDKDGFEITPQWSEPAPQIFEGATQLMIALIHSVGDSPTVPIFSFPGNRERIGVLDEDIKALQELHESYLARSN